MTGRPGLRWPEYLMEAAGLGLFMISAAGFAALLEHPASPVRQAIDDAAARRALMGLAMGLTAIAIIYSPWGRRSGAHINPAVTFTFWRLGKIRAIDALFYGLSQCLGALAGTWLAVRALPGLIAHPSVNYVATLPGPRGPGIAFLAEVGIAMTQIVAVLSASNSARFTRWTGAIAGALVALYITFESPLSGMSLNPARSLGSAALAGNFDHFWIYLAAPPLGMLLGAELWIRVRGVHRVLCAKLHHDNRTRCIFNCNFGRIAGTGETDTWQARSRTRTATT